MFALEERKDNGLGLGGYRERGLPSRLSLDGDGVGGVGGVGGVAVSLPECEVGELANLFLIPNLESFGGVEVGGEGVSKRGAALPNARGTMAEV